ncbi:MAG: hypothetical protein KF784_13490 [Fimbriimonadaceae bacterium]|nr:hypothetical protein [Fimbriimonadaceae bacterium]
MKKIFVLMSMMTLAVSFAAAQDDCCKEAVKPKVQAKQDSCCAAGKQVNSEEAFMAEARRMMAAAEAKKECCKSTAEKPQAKGEGDCCNAKGAEAKFKVFVAGAGYKFFGCKDSAAEGRAELLAKGAIVGKVQKVTGKVMI